MSELDLDAYFARIGHRGGARPTLETLTSLAERHPAAIPFENLSPFAGQEVPLELGALQHKLVHEHRGGYCFEHNLLLLAVLRELGFVASGLSARVLWNQPPESLPARGHMLLRVELDEGTYLVDAGFGALTLTAPLRLEVDTVQPTPHEPFRLVCDGDLYLQALVREQWRTLYRFELSEAFPSDYAVTNYYLSTHPRSHFRTGLIAARALPGQRLTLRDRRFTVYGGESRLLESPSEVREVLEGPFGLRVSDSYEEAFERLFL